MRPTLLLAVLLSLASAAHAKPEGWPAGGRCIPAVSDKAPCIQLSSADAAAIQRAVLAFIDAEKQPTLRSDYLKARPFVKRPITVDTIGAFTVHGYVFADFKDVIQLFAVESRSRSVETGFKITLRRDGAGWKVLFLAHTFEVLAEP